MTVEQPPHFRTVGIGRGSEKLEFLRLATNIRA